jgi:hypothetical protein
VIPECSLSGTLVSLQFTADILVHFGEWGTSFRYAVVMGTSGILDALTDPPTSATVYTTEGFLFAMCRAQRNM